MSSWWQDKTREEFARELETRFAVNRADPPSRGMAAKWNHEAASRGGQATKRLVHVTHRERMAANGQRGRRGMWQRRPHRKTA